MDSRAFVTGIQEYRTCHISVRSSSSTAPHEGIKSTERATHNHQFRRNRHSRSCRSSQLCYSAPPNTPAASSTESLPASRTSLTSRTGRAPTPTTRRATDTGRSSGCPTRPGSSSSEAGRRRTDRTRTDFTPPPRGRPLTPPSGNGCTRSDRPCTPATRSGAILSPIATVVPPCRRTAL